MNPNLKAFTLSTLLFLWLNTAFAQQVSYDWKHVIKGSDYTVLCCMAMDTSGNIYVGGRIDTTITFIDTTYVPGTITAFIAKLTPDGDLVWFKPMRYGSCVYSICFDSENMLYISGAYKGKVEINDSVFYTHDSDTTFGGMYMAKFNTGGDLIWAKTTAGRFYYENGYGKLKQMAIDKDDNLVLVGNCIEEIEYFDTTATYTKTLDSAWVTYPYPHWVYYYATTNYLAKFNKDGQKLWIKDVGMYSQHYYSIATDYSNNILLTGHFWDDYDFHLDTITLIGTAIDNIFIAKYDPNGHIIWAQRAGGSSNVNYGYDITADSTDGIYITGIISGNAIEFGGDTVLTGCSDYTFLTKLASTGNLEWFRHYGTEISASNYDYGLSLSYSNDEILLGGFFADSLNLGFTILDGYHSPPWFASGIFLRFNTNGDLVGAAMDHDSLQNTIIYFMHAKSGGYYVAGNLLGGIYDPFLIGQFSDWYLTDIDETEPSFPHFIIAPNPCKDFFYVISDGEPPYKLEIYDLNGRHIRSQRLDDNPEAVSVHGLPIGLYIVRINNQVLKLIII